MIKQRQALKTFLLTLIMMSILTHCQEEAEESMMMIQPEHYTMLNSTTLYPAIAAPGNWLIYFCHSKHWECEYLIQEWAEVLAQPLSTIIKTGYLDPYQDQWLREQFGAKMNPSLVLIEEGGKHFYLYKGNCSDLS